MRRRRRGSRAGAVVSTPEIAEAHATVSEGQERVTAELARQRLLLANERSKRDREHATVIAPLEKKLDFNHVGTTITRAIGLS